MSKALGGTKFSAPFSPYPSSGGTTTVRFSPIHAPESA